MFNKNLTSNEVIRRVVKWALIIDASLAALVATFLTYFAVAFATGAGPNAPALWEIAGVWLLGFGVVFFKAGIVIGVISLIFLGIALSGRSSKS
jgi:protein-S-isoprenylcysteine O-methyltransferase Ste14